jgi:hypothetical protein
MEHSTAGHPDDDHRGVTIACALHDRISRSADHQHALVTSLRVAQEGAPPGREGVLEAPADAVGVDLDRSELPLTGGRHDVDDEDRGDVATPAERCPVLARLH